MLRALFFQAWGSFTSLKSQTRDPQLKVSPPRIVLRIFTSWKNPSTSAGFEPTSLESRGEHGTPRSLRPTEMSPLMNTQKSHYKHIPARPVLCFKLLLMFKHILLNFVTLTSSGLLSNLSTVSFMKYIFKSLLNIHNSTEMHGVWDVGSPFYQKCHASYTRR